jgi:autotransporter-associated beta strand protein
VHIFNFGFIVFDNSSTAGGALIDNFNFLLDFIGSSTAGAATIHTFGGGGGTRFEGNATGGSAQLVTDAGGFVDFSNSAGPDGLGHVTAGSIAGAGTYNLGRDQLMVGLNGLSTEVSGPIEDGGIGGGVGASLVKVGHGTLKLSHAGNTYTGGTILAAGKLDVAAVGAAGTGAITFAGVAKLEVESAALSGHAFGNPIDFFARHDVLDLAGLKFHAGATATYNNATHHLTVHSGHVTDTLTLLSPHGHHFGTARDGHGTDVFLLHA